MKQGPKKRTNWEAWRARVRAANRARSRAQLRLQAANPRQWRKFLAEEYAVEGVTLQGPNIRTDPDRAAAVEQQDREREERRRDRERRNDLTGRVFGRLTVLERGPNSPPMAGVPNGLPQWWCRCECGNQKLARRKNLVSGDTKSCGCLAREKMPMIWAQEDADVG